jgi:16S rRNA (uracil1498-N3)-methyltransferase
MSFFYHESAGNESLKLDGAKFEHIFKVRRSKDDESLWFANLNDGKVYEYKTESIDRKSATLTLTSVKEGASGVKNIVIAWCVVDPKTIEKTLPFLNELGVQKIEFIYSKRSQKSYQIRAERLDAIIISSCEQCGRTQKMEFEVFDSLTGWLKLKKEFFVLDFGGEALPKELQGGAYLIGSEGGFDDDEKAKLKACAKAVYSFDSRLVFKSETAVMAIASRFA